MEVIEIDSRTFRELTLIAKAAGLTHGQAVAFLIEEFHRASSPAQVSQGVPDGIPVHATYQGQRVEGVFDTATGGLTVTSAPLPGKWFRSPSGAAKAVVAALKPDVTPNRSGYDFWFVNSTGKTLASIRSGR
ncbi:hypothetical protein OG792_28350 [Micromonospora sp. NBC_01699]|uniref:hypothetical protein n=1 Tax=Micromonospora sp. NBC_01699 TaxID=2975984 RepID=UPI002E29FDCF|nr:hypothetical protein [Micromonospora sp. NBC_01699]